MKKRLAQNWPVSLFLYQLRLLLAGSDGSHRASVSAGAAVDADVGIDRINVAFFDSSGGTLALASAASYTGIRGNFVSHNVIIKFISCVF